MRFHGKLCDDRHGPSTTTMRKEDWLKLAMPASATLLAGAIFSLPYVVAASGVMQVEGTRSYGSSKPITVKIDQRDPIPVKIEN